MSAAGAAGCTARAVSDTGGDVGLGADFGGAGRLTASLCFGLGGVIARVGSGGVGDGAFAEGMGLLGNNVTISGVFQILNVGPRVAQFRFVGWTNDARDSKRQTITVDAGLNGDVQLAIIDRMIELIRIHYSGDFNWDSQRLGRVVVLSARKSDQDELRRFMMREFF